MPPRTHITAHQLDQDQDLLTELRILSSLRPQDRISTNHAVKPVVRIQKPDFFRSVVRFFGSESRASNVAYIQSLLQRVIDRYTSAVQNGDMALQSRICEETESAVQGIRRLQQTYEDDAQFQAAINVSIDTVCIHLGLCLAEQRPMVPVGQKGVQEEQPQEGRGGGSGGCDDGGHPHPQEGRVPGIERHMTHRDTRQSDTRQSDTRQDTPYPTPVLRNGEPNPFDYTHLPPQSFELERDPTVTTAERFRTGGGGDGNGGGVASGESEGGDSVGGVRQEDEGGEENEEDDRSVIETF